LIDKFQIAVRELIDFKEVELLALSEYVETRQYKKGEILLKEGDHCNYIGFLNNGCFNFYYMKDGVELIRGFFFPNDFVSNYPCFLLKDKSRFEIKALVDSSVTLIHRDNLLLLTKEFPKFQELERIIAESLLIYFSDKFESFFSRNAEERYLDFIKDEYEQKKRIPQYMIASYLGITPEGLSRIKKRTSIKKIIS
jgi:CRP-like cAMP-binding protein